MITRLLLLPGMDGTGELFLDFMRALPEDIQASTLRYPPEVRLSYDELERMVREVAPSNEPFVLVAESFSTPLAISYAASHPSNFKGLVLCAGFAASPLKGWKRAVARATISLLPLGFLPSGIIKRLLVGPLAPESTISRVRMAIRQVKSKVLRHRLKCVLACDEREALANISVPVLYLQAKEDRLVPRACVKEILSAKPDVKIIELAGPHLLLQASPKAAAEAVMQFAYELD